MNIKNKYNMCRLALVVSFLAGWLVLADTPWPAVNFTFGLCLGAVVYLVALTAADGPLGPLVIRQNLERVGLVNKKGEAPFLLCKQKDPDNPNGFILTFENREIPRERWEEKQIEIESALNIFIIKIKSGKNRRLVEVYAVLAGMGLPDKIIWSPEYLSPTEFILILGRGLSGLVTVDLTKIPHILLGGSTGSGKTILLKLLLRQCVEKDASLYLIDLKGGMDYYGWECVCHTAYTMVKARDILKELVKELETRKEVLRRAGCANLQIYNERVRSLYKRIVIGCDEIAELLDKTGRIKADKEIIDEITGYLATIARQGRAMGIHIIAATQRPDSNTLPGQIKCNIDCRICGRADDVLSQIVLDSTAASDAIPKDAQGRFIMSDGTVFQGFWSNDLDDWFLL